MECTVIKSKSPSKHFPAFVAAPSIGPLNQQQNNRTPPPPPPRPACRFCPQFPVSGDRAFHKFAQRFQAIKFVDRHVS